MFHEYRNMNGEVDNITLRQRQLFKGKWDLILEYEQKNGKGKQHDFTLKNMYKDEVV